MPVIQTQEPQQNFFSKPNEINLNSVNAQRQLYSNGFRNPISGEFLPLGKNLENSMNLLFSNTSKENGDFKFPLFTLPENLEVKF